MCACRVQLPVAGEYARTDLAPTRTLLEAIPDLLGGFANGQVVFHIAAVPLVGFHDHTQSKILCEGVSG